MSLFGDLKKVCLFSMALLAGASGGVAHAQSLDLYVDTATKQVFTEPGPNRQKLGTFVPKSETGAAAGDAAAPSAPSDKSSATLTASAAKTPEKATEKHWFEKLSLRGYTQFRYTSLFDREGADWFHPADKTVAKDQTFLIRRGRVILSGDVSDRLFLYLQPELNASPQDGDFSVQLRDAYGDVALDLKKEFRFRFGQSKVPYGFANMQSSQNRVALERPEAINSAAEGERDIGTFFYWAPEEIRARFKKLVKDGLKGSGDYGVVGLGAYSGQGPNRSDLNGNLHSVARVSYPFLFDNGQFFEPGIQAYTGRFVPRTQALTLEDGADPTAPKFRSNGVTDQRAAVSMVLYPQPFGIEAEWNVGRGPQLSDDFLSIEDGSLTGGYIMADLKLDSGDLGTFVPFVRWQYFDGGRKFAKNSPDALLNEWDFGIEYSPFPEFELTAEYSYTNNRTNTNAFPYDSLTSGSRLGLQAQLNY